MSIRKEDAVLAEGEVEAKADRRVRRRPRAAAGGDGGTRSGVGEGHNDVLGEEGCRRGVAIIT